MDSRHGVGSNVGGILEVKSTGPGDPSDTENEREDEVKVTLEVFSLVDSEGSDAFNDKRNIRRKEEAWELVHDKFVFDHVEFDMQE